MLAEVILQGYIQKGSSVSGCLKMAVGLGVGGGGGCRWDFSAAGGGTERRFRAAGGGGGVGGGETAPPLDSGVTRLSGP